MSPLYEPHVWLGQHDGCTSQVSAPPIAKGGFTAWRMHRSRAMPCGARQLPALDEKQHLTPATWRAGRRRSRPGGRAALIEASPPPCLSRGPDRAQPRQQTKGTALVNEINAGGFRL